MFRLTRFCGLILAPLAACATATDPAAQRLAAPAAPAQTPAPPTNPPDPAPTLEKIADGVWLHKSYKTIKPWGPIRSNGLLIVARDEALLIDTAWSDEQTSALLDDIQSTIGFTPGRIIGTHAHDDKIGGLGALHRAGVVSYAHAFALEDAPARGLVAPQRPLLFLEDRAIIKTAEGDETIAEIYYPGPGHTRDNIVVYIPSAKILFGGCLIQPGGARSLGNTADGDVKNWATATRRVAAQFPEAEIIIPSHGPPGGRALLDHTIALGDASANAQ
ncbi:MAG: subclass B1 metallo-beta-lactamase [Pseudomonadota bacterium]